MTVAGRPPLIEMLSTQCGRGLRLSEIEMAGPRRLDTARRAETLPPLQPKRLAHTALRATLNFRG
jgi:hypothetical protein